MRAYLPDGYLRTKANRLGDMKPSARAVRLRNAIVEEISKAYVAGFDDGRFYLQALPSHRE